MFAYILLVCGTNMQDKKYKKFMKKEPVSFTSHNNLHTLFYIQHSCKVHLYQPESFSFHLGFTSIDVREGRGLMTANACEENMSC